MDRTLDLRLSFPGEEPTRAVGQGHEWTMFERVRRGALGMALCWVGAGISIFMPILHFVLVPGLIVAGPIFGALQLSEKMRLRKIKGSCPRCKVEREYQLSLRFNGPRSFTCDGCGNLIELQQVGAEPKPA
ncbi:MAG: hypothetical protein IPJ65_02650 [Archangiaceae bacterium]|nr:hypothetical protein [Archangiaceae bacterium]